MNSRMTICALAALMCCASAWAQEEGATTDSADSPAAKTASPTSVTLYGLLDEGVEYLSHNAASKGASMMQVGAGMNTSYFGFRGTEDLGGGLHIIFNLEGGVSPDTGTSLQGGRLFGRQSWVGIEGNWGRLTIGRQYTMKSYATVPINMFGTGAQGLPTLDSGVANPRADNAVSYRVSLTKEIEAGVNYSTGRDGVATTPTTAAASNCPESTVARACKEYSAMVKYSGEHWGVDTAYERNVGGTAATFGGLTTPDKSDSRYILGGWGKVKDVKVAVGWMRRINEGIATPHSNMYWVMGTLGVARNVILDGVVAQLKYDASPNRAFVVGTRAVYKLSVRTQLYATAEYLRNSGALAISASTLAPVSNPVAGGSQVSFITGIQHVF